MKAHGEATGKARSNLTKTLFHVIRDTSAVLGADLKKPKNWI